MPSQLIQKMRDCPGYRARISVGKWHAKEELYWHQSRQYFKFHQSQASFFAPFISFLLRHRENAFPYELGEPDLWCSLRFVLNYPPGLVQVLWCSHAGEKLSVLFRVAVKNLKEVSQMGMMKYARNTSPSGG